MPLEPDPYRTLGLTRGASLDEVKRAYRRLAKANHPDAAGPAALSRFLAIQAAYDLLTGPSGGERPAGGGARTGPRPTGRQRPSAAEPDRTEATRRAYRARSGAGADDTEPGSAARSRRARPAEPGDRPSANSPGGEPGAAAGSSDTGETRTRAARGKATLGSTSYDGAEAGPFEPDWGGASWYGTTSGTYWTINPREYADPRKHGPEYQARARRSTGARGVSRDASSEGHPEPVTRPTHTTGSWWESTAGPQNAGPQNAGSQSADPQEGTDGIPGTDAGPSPARATPDRQAGAFERQFGDHVPRPPYRDDPAPDPARAAIDLGRALADPRSGGLRGRLARAVLGWIPIALGIGWVVGELTGCGRFAATCDPSVTPLTAAGQGIVLVALVFVPEVAAIAAGAALVLLAAAVGATLILSATGTAADEGSRRAALGALLLVAWLSGLAIAVFRRYRTGSRSSRPVS